MEACPVASILPGLPEVPEFLYRMISIPFLLHRSLNILPMSARISLYIAFLLYFGAFWNFCFDLCYYLDYTVWYRQV